MKTSRKILIYSLSALLVAGIGALLINSGADYDSEDTSVPVATSTPVESSVATTTAEKENVPTSASENLTVSCGAALKQDLKEKDVDYSKGSVLVSFDPSTSFEDAAEILSVEKISYDKDDFNDDSFESKKWLIGNVKVGAETDVVCALQTYSEVRHADVNRLLDLHE